MTAKMINKWKERLNWEPDHEYFLSFVGMGVVNPNYEDYVGGGGRLEIDDETEPSPFSDLEINYLTKKTDKLNEFRKKWDFETVNGEQLEEIMKIITEKFRDGYQETESQK
jgi:hypothetical protein